jgi:[acyl-carrier-protein] S-malonyltransferase
MSLAFVFPGQGSQSVGMLAALAADESLVRSTFDDASATLGYDLWRLVQSGPADELNATERTQPALLAAGIAVWRVWRRRGGPTPSVVSGHSLGEFTALVAASALDFRAAIELVRFRGQVMQEAVPIGAGAMAAILGLEDGEVETACREAAQGGVVEAVNYNSPGQLVIAGDAAAVDRAIEASKARGAKRAVRLAVSAPFHSSLMRGAAERFRAWIAGIDIRAPQITYVSAVDARVHADPHALRSLLVTQLASPVRWTETVRALINARTGTLVECGPGKVLTGLNRRIERRADIQCLAIEDSPSIDAAIAACLGAAHA